MSDESHLGNDAMRETVKLGVGALFLALATWAGIARKRISAWWYRSTVAIETLTQETKRQTDQITHIAAAMDKAVALAVSADRKGSVADIRTRILMRESSVPRWECDENGHCVEVNDALCSMFGRPRDLMLGTRWTQAIAPGLAPQVMAAFHAAYAGVNDYEYVQPYAITRNNGAELVNIIASSEEVLRDDHGKVIRMWGKCRYQPTLVEEQKSA
jgi:PAS domain S-box-containing protein